jgi:hypothetical protein
MAKTLFKTAAVGALVATMALASVATVAEAGPRYRRGGGNGGAVAAGLALGLIGAAAIAASQQPRYYDEPGYYGRPRYYGQPQPAYVYDEPSYGEPVYVRRPRPAPRSSGGDVESPSSALLRSQQYAPPVVYYQGY